jgi:hypothetical protein
VLSLRLYYLDGDGKGFGNLIFVSPIMVLMETEQITAQEWHDRYLQPFYNLASDPNAEPTSEMQDGYAGFVLDGILAVKNIDGQEANDWECVELVEELIRYAMIMDGRVDNNE